RAITTFAADTTSSTNVNDKVNATNIAITNNSFDPNNHGSSTLISNFTVNGKVNQGDYFTVKYPENFSVDGDFDYRSKNNIMVTDPLNDLNGNTVATGKYNTTDKTVTYTFTDYVNNKENISGNIFLPIWTDREKTPDSGDYNVSFNVADETLDTSINVDYTSPIKPEGAVKGDNKPGITSFITEIDKNPNNPTYKQTIIVNPLENRLNDSRVKVYGYDPDDGGRAGSSAVIDRQNTSFKVYRVNDSNKLNDSYYINPDDPNLTDVTTDFDEWIYFNGGNTADIQFGDIDSTYVITVDGHYNPNSTNPIRTRVEELNRIAEGSANRINYTFDNENIIRTTGGSAHGENIQRYNLGDYVWEDTNQNGLQDSNENGISGVTVTLKDVDGNILTTTTTDDTGKYQFTNLINGTYKVDFETPAGFIPTDANVNNDTTDESDSDGLSAIGVINGADNLTIDSGFYKQPVEKYQVGDRVWYDTNKNGIQDEGENGIGGVTVLLKKDNRTISNTVTDREGKYGFYDLEKGDYTLEFIHPDGYQLSPTNQGGNIEKDSNGLVTPVHLENDDYSYDLGLFKETDDGYEITVEDVSYENVVRPNTSLPKNTIQLVQQGQDGRDRVYYKELGYNADTSGIDDSKLLEEEGYYWQEVRRDPIYSSQDAIFEYNLENNEGVTNITYNPTTNEYTVEYSNGDKKTIEGPKGSSLTIEGQTDLPNGDIEVKFSDGTTLVVPKGSQGAPGPKGKDGKSTKITQEAITDDEGHQIGVAITVTDADGHSETTNILNGEQGPKGEDGVQGPKGEDGDKGKDGTSSIVDTKKGTKDNHEGTWVIISHINPKTGEKVEDNRTFIPDGNDGQNGKTPSIDQQPIKDKDGNQIGTTIIVNDGNGKEVSRQDILNGQDGQSVTTITERGTDENGHSGSWVRTYEINSDGNRGHQISETFIPDGQDGQSVTAKTERGKDKDGNDGSYIRVYEVNPDGSLGKQISETFVKDGTNGTNGTNGQDGQLPTINQIPIRDNNGNQIGVTVTIKDKDGNIVSKEDIYNGKDGKTPTVEQEPVTDKDGNQTGVVIITRDGNGNIIDRQTVLNGKDGADGKDGKDGKSVTAVAEPGSQNDVEGSYIRTYEINPDGTRGKLISETFVPNGQDGKDGKTPSIEQQ
ncbi:SdrD B-like domain-containing protein, partial [Staphylococcus hominis]|uniref:SdrD B-like domain-containing protein n=1 Tax=Staphylococcus hominis TaxID=1290 RepID=UPI00159F6547